MAISRIRATSSIHLPLGHILGLVIVTATWVSLPACEPSAEGDLPAGCEDGNCDQLDSSDAEVEDSPCDGILVDKSGRGYQKIAGRLNDPFARNVLRAGDDCPVELEEIFAKFRNNETDGDCALDNASLGNGMTTWVVSETAQALGRDDGNTRAITMRSCDPSSRRRTFFAQAETSTDGQLQADGVEIMSFDERARVFNFYRTSGSSINWYGNSEDMLLGFQSGTGGERVCAGCHSGGGLVMKEFEKPYLHWENQLETPGSQALVASNPFYGERSTGPGLRGEVDRLNERWNQRRIAYLREQGSTREILRPLFCTVEVNVDSDAEYVSPTEGLLRVALPAIIEPSVKRWGGIAIYEEDYDSQILANHQRVEGIPGAIDTVYKMPFITRSSADQNYVWMLQINAGIIDLELARDIAAVDFTRPVFSEDRCGLLEYVPNIPDADLNPDTLRQALIESLEDAEPGTPAAQLKANLESESGHNNAARAFMSACEGLFANEFAANALTYISSNREKARNLPVFEFRESLPSDDLEVPPGTRLDPITCQLTTSFVTVSLGGSGQ